MEINERCSRRGRLLCPWKRQEYVGTHVRLASKWLITIHILWLWFRICRTVPTSQEGFATIGWINTPMIHFGTRIRKRAQIDLQRLSLFSQKESEPAAQLTTGSPHISPTLKCGEKTTGFGNTCDLPVRDARAPKIADCQIDFWLLEW